MSGAATGAVQLVSDLEQASTLLEPTRLRLVRELAEPDSATGLARRLQLPRQRVNYHLRELERAGLVRLVEERRKRNCVERVVQATARAYLIDPDVLAGLGPDPERVRDRFSWAYLVAIATRTIRELAILRRRADRARQKLATFTLETQVRLPNARALNAFTDELADAVGRLVSRYHDECSPTGRLFRFVLGSYPAITRPEDGDQHETHQPDTGNPEPPRDHGGPK